MKFLILFAAILVRRNTAQLNYRRNNFWYDRLADYLESIDFIKRSPVIISFILSVFIPLLVLHFTFIALDGEFLNIPLFVLQVGLLVYCLGRDDFKGRVEQYLNHWSEQKFKQAFETAEDFMRHQGIHSTDSPRTLHEGLCHSLLYRWFERFFCVIFWFLLLDVYGALFYVFSKWWVKRDYENREFIKIALEWIPSRLLGFTFALVGNFVNASSLWISEIFKVKIKPRVFLNDIGLIALDVNTHEVDDDEFLDAAVTQVEALHSLLVRSAVVWVVIVSVLVIIGDL